MDRKLTKKDVKEIRLSMGLTQVEFSELLGISISHLQKTEQVKGSSKYEVSDKLDRLIKSKFKEMGVDIGELLELIDKGGHK